MILIKIATRKEEMVKTIAAMLLEEKLAVDINIKKDDRIELLDNELSTKTIFLITGKTKALLYSSIEKRFREKFLADMPELYSLPIINMDWEQAEKLAQEVKKF